MGNNHDNNNKSIKQQQRWACPNRYVTMIVHGKILVKNFSFIEEKEIQTQCHVTLELNRQVAAKIHIQI